MNIRYGWKRMREWFHITSMEGKMERHFKKEYGIDYVGETEATAVVNRSSWANRIDQERWDRIKDNHNYNVPHSTEEVILAVKTGVIAYTGEEYCIILTDKGTIRIARWFVKDGENLYVEPLYLELFCEVSPEDLATLLTVENKVRELRNESRNRKSSTQVGSNRKQRKEEK